MGKKHSLPLIFLVLLSFDLSGQGGSAQDDYYNWFDELVGIENTSAYDGTAYIETQRTINEKTKFFKAQDYLTGSMVYDGQRYSNLKMKYDVFGDKLLLKLEDRLGGTTLQLFKDKLTSFVIDGHSFVKISSKESGAATAAFYENVLQKEDFELFVKHEKREFLRKDRSFIYYEFIDQKNQNLLRYKDAYHQIESKKDVVKLFPELKKQINKFYSTARLLKNSDQNEFMKALVTRLDILLSQGNNSTAE